ncbi:DUF302 domain-containing protein [Halomonas stenophila]|uniref:Uncharacterized protein (DUF302 family) n=1 Tax=Halomonas stenophila TaxID=795312 RepID=A0A7W5EX73_9GAMM|nr:DUF302 domain-containing protein [Halomonas stenophila]MBB3232351.1 uncharacterized protein (DUF302 family) [Halomonas stenophila]
MRRVTRPLAMLGLAMGVALGAAADDASETSRHGILHRISQDEVARVDGRLREALEARGMRLMTVVDHAENAAGVDLELPETRTFIFGNPAVGTPMMQCRGSLALDLPQKMLLRETAEGTRIEWNDPHYLARRHDLGACDLPLGKVAGALSGIAEAAAGD